MDIEAFIRHALEEDTGSPTNTQFPGDHTSLACIAPGTSSKGQLLVKEKGVLAGVELAKNIFHFVDPELHFELHLEDGTQIEPGQVAFFIEGDVHSILLAERLVLNFMQRMSGIATLTHRFVQAVEGSGCRVLDTRKTTPNLRFIEKWAVRIGGGENHRHGLYDMVMIKDNHIDYCGGIKKAILAVQSYLSRHDRELPVEVETRSLDDVRTVLEVGQVNRIMLDNFTPAECKEAVAIIAEQYETEASGGITLETVAAYAETGVEYISVGALTHSHGSLDLSLKAI